MCYAILSGTGFVVRTKDEMVMTTSTSPTIVGVTNFLSDEFSNDFKLYAKTRLVVDAIEVKDAIDIINEKDLWMDLSFVLSYSLAVAYLNGTVMMEPNAYKVICSLLYRLDAEHPDVKTQQNVCQYIQERSYLSRSFIMNILSDLRKGGVITLERGVLLKIDRLPEKY